jgi:hypothetical protein
MISEEDITLQKYSNYHSAWLLLWLSWVVLPPWLSVNYDFLARVLSDPSLNEGLVGLGLISIYGLALAVIWNRMIESESALKSKCVCS